MNEKEHSWDFWKWVNDKMLWKDEIIKKKKRGKFLVSEVWIWIQTLKRYKVEFVKEGKLILVAKYPK